MLLKGFSLELFLPSRDPLPAQEQGQMKVRRGGPLAAAH
jgi:hypothetical protein